MEIHFAQSKKLFRISQRQCLFPSKYRLVSTERVDKLKERVEECEMGDSIRSVLGQIV